MSEIARLIQQQVPLDSKLRVFLTTGKEAVGDLHEIGRDHVTLNNDGKPITILVNIIGGWEVIGDYVDHVSSAEEATVESDKENVLEVVEDSQNQQETPNSSTSVASDVGSSTPENQLVIYSRLVEVTAHFQAHLQTARIELIPPDFVFPANDLKQPVSQVDANKLWVRFINRYNYASKVNELGATHGRLPNIISDLEDLHRWYPRSESVSDHLGYFYYLSSRKQDALEAYKKSAIRSQSPKAWYNLAAISFDCGQEELCCHSLEQFFRVFVITERLDAWYLFIRLSVKFSNYRALEHIFEALLTRADQQEIAFFFDTIVFLLNTTSNEVIAQQSIRDQLQEQPLTSLILKAFGHFESDLTQDYQGLISELEAFDQIVAPISASERSQQHRGFIYSHKGKYGFLRDQDGSEYYFHNSALADAGLMSKLESLAPGQEIPVIFQLAQGPQGKTIAVSVSTFRTVDEMFKLAVRYANEGEYNLAIGQIKKVLIADPSNPKAKELYEKWREYARATGVPKGSNPYARAKQVQLVEKDLDRAERLFRTAIAQKDNWESAVKDLAMLLDQMGRTEEAINLLKKYRGNVNDKQSVDNLLTSLYSKAEFYDQAITLLTERLQQAKTSSRRVSLLWQIGNAYLRKEQYGQAEKHFRQILRLQRDNQAAERNLAICLFKQERFDEAEEILNRILNTSSDTRAAELLDAIRQAKQTGYWGKLDEIIVELTLSELYLSGEVSLFTQFFLDRCQFEGVKPERVQAHSFVRADIRQLEDLATKLGTSRPRQRASYYLSAAKIVSILEDGTETNQLFRYLCRCFASMGDAAVVEGKHLDSARELYCEALAVYDGDRTEQKREQDAVNALVRFLHSTLGQSQIPMKPDIPTVDDTLDFIMSNHPEKDRAFDAIAYLVARSRYAANLILKRLYDKEYSLRAMALEYLRNHGISTSKQMNTLSSFVQLWNELRRKRFNELRTMSTEIRFVAGFEFTTASLEVRIEQLKGLGEGLFFELDHRRLTQIKGTLEIAFELCQQEKFSDQERLAEQVERNCQELLDEIESNPTKISIEEMHPVIRAIQNKTAAWKEQLYERSTPDLAIHLPIEAYIPNRTQLGVQVAISNRIGCSPAESLELIVRQDGSLFSVTKTDVRLFGSLDGGDSEIIEIPLRVTNRALASQAFSLPLYARYRTRSGNTVETQEYNFSVRLSSANDFVEIINPYAPYAESGIVEDENMFYGRENLIQNIARAIQNSRTKSVVIYGQKRAGKSSILYHLKKKLETDRSLLVLDWGNIGSIRDENSRTPLLYQILWGILEELQFAIEDKIDEGFVPPDISLPGSSLEFLSHPDPLTHFKEIFERFKRKTFKLERWRNVRAVLLIDEFTYIFDWILKDEISDSFMKNWKALLQENYFSAVLVGQDYMPKFKLRFPNEFGTTQDERVTYLRKEDAVRLIDEPIRIGGKNGESRYREQAIETIFALTAGSPFYIQIVCNRLVEHMNRKRAKFVTEADVKQVKNDLISGVNALDVGKFDNLVDSGDTSVNAISKEDALKILTIIAHNSRTGLCHRSSIACHTKAPIDEVLGDLVNREVVEQRDQHFRIQVELFRDWLVVHPMR